MQTASEPDSIGRPRKGLWRVLNEPFVLALLPSLALVTLPLLFSFFQQKFTQAAEEDRMVRLIDVEIPTRVANALSDLDSWDDPDWGATENYKATIVLRTLDGISDTRTTELMYSHPELQDWSLRALLEHRRALRPDTRHPDIRAASQILVRVRHELTRIRMNSKTQEVHEVVNSARESLEQAFGYWLLKDG